MALLSVSNGMYMLQHKQTDVDQQQLLPLQADFVFSMAVAAFYLAGVLATGYTSLCIVGSMQSKL